jgi:hypothetical protein
MTTDPCRRRLRAREMRTVASNTTGKINNDDEIDDDDDDDDDNTGSASHVVNNTRALNCRIHAWSLARSTSALSIEIECSRVSCLCLKLPCGWGKQFSIVVNEHEPVRTP